MREVAAKHPKTGEVVQCFTVKLSPSGLLIVFHNDDGEVFKLHRYGWRALVEAVQAEIAERRVHAEAEVATREGNSTVSMLDMIFLRIAQERAHQDEKWGGPGHDDGHDALEWLEIIRQHAMKAAKAGAGIGQPRDLAAARQHYVEVAAVAVAAIEALDRYAEEHEPALTDAIGMTCSACGGSGLLATPIELLGDPLECPACAGTGIRQNNWQESD